MKQQQPFYGPLIQDNPGELVPETIRYINPRYHHYGILHSTSNQSSLFTTKNESSFLNFKLFISPPLLPYMFSLVYLKV